MPRQPPFQPSTDIVYLRDKTSTLDLTSGLNELRKQNILCDVNIRVGDATYAAHKVVLSVASGYFKSMFTSGFRETNSSEVTIQGMKNIKTLFNFKTGRDVKAKFGTCNLCKRTSRK